MSRQNEPPDEALSGHDETKVEPPIGATVAGDPVDPMVRLTAVDEEWYLRHHPEARRAIRENTVRDAHEHFDLIGAAAGYQPNVWFCEDWYRANNPDVRAAIEHGHLPTGLSHFAAHGCAEGRRPGPVVVHHDWYLQSYSLAREDLATGMYHDVLRHYLLVGSRNGCNPHSAFDESWFLAHHPEAKAGVASGRYVSGYQYLCLTGWGEGTRRLHPDYCEETYLFMNPDVEHLVRRGDYVTGYHHLVTCGIHEGRMWRTSAARSPVERVHTSIGEALVASWAHARPEMDHATSEAVDVSAVVRLGDRPEVALRGVAALSALIDISYEIILVPALADHPSHHALAWVEGARSIAWESEQTVAEVLNRAAESARGRYLLFMDDGVEVPPSSVRLAVQRMQVHDRAGIVTCRVIGPDGRLDEAGRIVWADGRCAPYGQGDDPNRGQYLYCREVDSPSVGVALVDRHELQRIGGFDSAFADSEHAFMDLSFRLRSLGCATIYEPFAVALRTDFRRRDDCSLQPDTVRLSSDIFVRKHAEALGHQPPVDSRPVFCAADRRVFRDRVLIVDDLPPIDMEGAGAPRMREIITALHDLGCFLTLFCVNPVKPSRRPLLARSHYDRLEIISDAQRGDLQEFLDQREGFYSTVIVSRPHNMQWVVENQIRLTGMRLIYDAEAVYSERARLRDVVFGKQPRDESAMTLGDELALIGGADVVWTVSELERQQLAAGGTSSPVVVVPHAVTVQPSDRGFAQRHGVVFVGRLSEENTPNVDGLRWFLYEVWPRLAGTLPPSDRRLTVVGELGSVDLPHPEGVFFDGTHADLGDVFASARLFIAPARFAAGIPLKVVTAASYGLPAAASTLLVRQLGWTIDREIVDAGSTPETFAAAIARACSDEELWRNLQAGALERVRSDYSREQMKLRIGASLWPQQGR